MDNRPLGDSPAPLPPPPGAPAGERVDAAAEAVARVLAEIDRLRAEKSGWGGKLILLLASLALFYGFGLLQNLALTLTIVIGVVLFHELGHYLGMRLFGYQDVSIFFIPFFGGGTTGRATGVPGYQRAIVALLGPLPGLVLALAFGAAYLVTGWTWPGQVAWILYLINAFNLLPFYPLDGGQLIYEVLLCRHRWIETGFRISSGVVLAVLGAVLALSRSGSQAWVFVVAGAYVIIKTLADVGLAAMAERARGLLGGRIPPPGPDSRIPPAAAVPIIAEVLRANPRLPNVRAIAWRVEAVWERLSARPPGWLAAAGLLALYGAAVSGCVLVLVILWLAEAAKAAPK